jgi:chromosome segregation ATPase
MTVVSDIQKLQEQVNAVEEQCESTGKKVARHEEQINGARGLYAAINAQTEEIRSLRKAAYWVGGLIIAGAIGFAFSVLLLIPGP